MIDVVKIKKRFPIFSHHCDWVYLDNAATTQKPDIVIKGTLDFYETLAERQGLSFATKITVLNKQFKKAENEQYPIATLQLNGKNLIEIDEVVEQIARPLAPCGLPAGIAWLSFYCQSPLIKNTNQLINGPADELIEILSSAS